MEYEDSLQEGILLQRGKYKIIKTIGQGGFGITYKAKMKLEAQGAIGKMIVESDVAIKEFFIKSECEREENSNAVTVPSKKKAGFIEDYRKKFVKEANNLSKLNHENIVKVIDIFEENNTAYFVMEYISGESLEAIVEKRGPMSETETMQVVDQLAMAVDYIHRNSVSHFDIKPANILISETGSLKLVDFGLAKHYDSDGKQTSTGLVQGVSEGFSPVEQYEVGALNRFSPQSDIYSVGATIAYLLTGKVPLSPFKKQLPALPSSVGASLKQGVYAAMSLDIEDRPKSISEFMQMIGREMKVGTTQKPIETIINIQDRGNKKEIKQSSVNGLAVPPAGGGTGRGTEVLNSDSSKMPKWANLLIIALFIFIFIVLVKDCDGPAHEPTPEPEEVVVADTAPVADTIPCNPLSEKNEKRNINEPQKTEGYINGHKWVDLGLPSGLKWATCNVGASSPGDHGNYYAWGEIATKDYYGEENCKTFNIGKMVRDIYQDVAQVNWGGTWRTPRSDAFLELEDNCNWEWTRRGGHYGFNVTSKTNGESIFFPAAGYYSGDELLDAGSVGMYWCSSYYKDKSDLFRFINGTIESYHDTTGRYWGFTIRPVSE